ncbi:MAG: mechanosensitive ion channel family protein [Candidatus Gracilibacteria bacterium]
MSFLSSITYSLIALTNSSGSATETANPVTAFLLEKLPSYLIAVVLLGISFIIARLARNVISRKFEEEKLRDTPVEIVILMKRLAFTLVFVICALISLGITGLIGNLGWLFGAIGLAIGVSFQGIATHFISGILIILQKKTGVGNYVKLADTEGTILEIGTRATTIQTLDGIEVLVPNKNFIDNEVIIYTSNPYRRLSVPVQLGYDADISQVSKLILELLSKHEEIIQDAPKEVLMSDFGDSYLDLTVRFWIKSRSEWWTIQSDITKQIKGLYDTNNITVPYPQRVIHVIREDMQHPVHKIPETNT